MSPLTISVELSPASPATTEATTGGRAKLIASHSTSTDKTASLPANYTFTAASKGVHTFKSLVLRTKGAQKITLTDTLNSSLTGSVIENVL